MGIFALARLEPLTGSLMSLAPLLVVLACGSQEKASIREAAVPEDVLGGKDHRERQLALREKGDALSAAEGHDHAGALRDLERVARPELRPRPDREGRERAGEADLAVDLGHRRHAGDGDRRGRRRLGVGRRLGLGLGRVLTGDDLEIPAPHSHRCEGEQGEQSR